MSEWMPIATAPRDGTPILVCGGKYGYEHFGSEFHNVTPPRAFTAFYDTDGEFRATEDYGYYFRPTHWQPLPEPPTT